MSSLKGAFRSFTIWFNSLMAVVIASLPLMQDSFPELQSYVPSKWYHYAMGLLIVGNILLRIKTTTSLAEKVQK